MTGDRYDWGIRMTWPDGTVAVAENPGFSNGEQWAHVISRSKHEAKLEPVRRVRGEWVSA